MATSPGPRSAARPRDEGEAATAAPRPVVVGIGNDQPDLLDHAAQLARALDVPLRVIHAAWRSGSSADPDRKEDTTKNDGRPAQRVLDEARAHLETSGLAAVEYEQSSAPAAEVLEAESRDADLVVIAAEPARWPDRFIGHRVARHVVFRASCPVVVVPPGAPITAGEVVAAIDLDHDSRDVLAVAVNLAARLDTPLHVVSAVLPGLRGPALAHQRVRLDQHVHDWRVRHPGVDIRAEVIGADAARAVIELGEAARLVVMGRPGDPLIAPPISPRVVTAVLRGSRCPVVVVPSAG